MISAYWYKNWKILDFDLWLKRSACLVFDLDNTLLESSTSRHAQNAPDVHYIVLPSPCAPKDKVSVRIRPYAKQLLQEAVSLGFECVIYTQGVASYVEQILPVLDPGDEIFKRRYISRATDGKGNVLDKNLNRLPISDLALVLVLDDRLDVWPEEQRWHILHISRYLYFTTCLHARQPIVSDEWPEDPDNVLRNLIPVLKLVKYLLTDGRRPTYDARIALRRIQSSVLHDLYFCEDDLPTDAWFTAEYFGARIVRKSEDKDSKEIKLTPITLSQFNYSRSHFVFDNTLSEHANIWDFCHQDKILDYEKTKELCQQGTFCEMCDWHLIDKTELVKKEKE